MNVPQPLWEPRALTPNDTIDHRLRGNTTNRRQRHVRRCHGNRKLRCFKKKCRLRGMNDEEIQRLIQNYDHRHQRNPIQPPTTSIDNRPAEHGQPNTTMTTMESTVKKTSRKRKHLVTSKSTSSISSRMHKRKRKKKSVKSHGMSTKLNYRLPKYLKNASNLLFQSIRLQLKRKLNDKKEQKFIYRRLQLLDQQQRIDKYRHLWQTYLNLGFQYDLWPVSLTMLHCPILFSLFIYFQNQVHKIIKSMNSNSYVDYIENRLNKLDQKFNECTTELIEHNQQCPVTLQPLESIDQQLKEFVELQQKQYIHKINTRLIRHQDYIHENEIYQTLLSHIHTEEQVS